MASNSREGPLKIHLVHGAKNHSVTLSLSPDDCSDVLIVDHLATVAQDISGIPPDRQKLIFKGKTLNSSGDTNLKSLKSFGIKNGSKIMLLGSKPSRSPTESGAAAQEAEKAEAMNPFREDLNKLQSVETSLASEADSFRGLRQEVDKMTTSRDCDDKELQRLKKQLMASGECFMRLLESLDGLRFDASDTDSRAKRKAMVNEIQRWMDQCEELSTSIKQRLASKK